MRKVAVLASGNVSNAENLCHFFAQRGSASLAVILSNHSDAGVMARAHRLKIPAYSFTTQEMLEGSKHIALLTELGIDLIVLAGYMCYITVPYLESFPDRIVNIHPALLPKFGGKGMYGHHVHEAVLAAREKESGITIHLVDGHYDHGKILHQAICPVLPEDTPDTLAERIHALEYAHYPEAIEEYLLRLPTES